MKMSYPGLVFYVTENFNYGKFIDINSIQPPTEELYNAYMGDWMTLGREIPNFSEFQLMYIQKKFEVLKRNAKCKFSILKFVAHSFEEIEQFYLNPFPGFVKFIDNELNEHFNIDKINLRPIKLSIQNEQTN